MVENLLCPLIAAVLGGAILYLINFFKLKRSIYRGLLIEISRLIENSVILNNIFSKPNFPCINVGEKIFEPPFFYYEEESIFPVFLDHMFLFGPKKSERIIKFYTTRGRCSKETEIIFNRVHLLQKSQIEVNQNIYDIYQLRMTRLKIIYDLFCKDLPQEGGIKKITDLPEKYSTSSPDLKEIEKRIAEQEKNIEIKKYQDKKKEIVEDLALLFDIHDETVNSTLSISK